ncbi:MAG: hypothetical protein AMXMBFR84_14580 [Candidatus Hydrogenedentota bacterium]
MPKFGVTVQKEAELFLRMEKLGLREEDLNEQFVRSSGSGGQHVNKTATCVQLVHEPSGLDVKMQQARSQSLNRYYARKRMCELMEARVLGDESPEAKKVDKIRKQKARRQRRSRSAIAD